jgi:uncharacterized Rmd1/YagE family protein
MDDLHVRIRVHHDTLADVPAPLARSRSAPREREREREGRARAPQKPPLKQLRALTGRTAGRQVVLGPSWEDEVGAAAAAAAAEGVLDAEGGLLPPPPAEVPSQFQGPGLSVRVRCYCLGDAFDRSQLQDHILRRGAPSVRAYPEVLCSAYGRGGGGVARAFNDVLYFDWGSVVFWGLEKSAERHILRELAEPCLGTVLPWARRERESIRVLFTSSPATFIENDTLAMHYRHAGDMDVRLAVSFALAQSTKLSVYEEVRTEGRHAPPSSRVCAAVVAPWRPAPQPLTPLTPHDRPRPQELRRMGRQLAYVPAQLADSGCVPLPERDVMRAVGHLYQQMQQVTLLGAALDVPETVSSAPSNIRALYKATYEYLEVAERLQLVNQRFAVMREMLELCRTLGQQAARAWAETLVMWLVGVCVVLAVFQLVGFIGWRPAWRD